MSNTKTLYFGAGWFDEKQNKAYKDAMDALKKNKTVDLKHSFIPLENQYKGIDVGKHPEYLHDVEWAYATYRGDLLGIKASDIMFGVYVPSSEDAGLGMELGYAMSQGKYIILAIPDEDFDKPINLMSWGVADKVIKMSELKDFNFNKPTFNMYTGGVC